MDSNQSRPLNRWKSLEKARNCPSRKVHISFRETNIRMRLFSHLISGKVFMTNFLSCIFSEKILSNEQSPNIVSVPNKFLKRRIRQSKYDLHYINTKLIWLKSPLTYQIKFINKDGRSELRARQHRTIPESPQKESITPNEESLHGQSHQLLLRLAFQLEQQYLATRCHL